MPRKQKTRKYKLKTYKAAAKRFRVTGGGKIVRTRGPKSHLRRNKASRTRAELSGTVEVKTSGEKRRVRRLLPYLRKFRANPPGG